MTIASVGRWEFGMAEQSKSGIVFITGASSGFGAACARKFAEVGYALVLAARRSDRLLRLAEELATDIHCLELDVRDRQAIVGALAGLPHRFAAIDVLINNAGVSLGIAPAWEGDLDDWDAMVDTNIKGLIYCTRHLLAGMVQRDRGHVVNIGSPAAGRPYPGGNIYASSKAFVRQFSYNLRADLLGTKVRVTCIEPGLARTDLFDRRFKGDRQQVEALFEGVDVLTADDVAEAVLWSVRKPAHVNVNLIELMPVAQAFAPLAVARRTPSG